jgi:hypothetical protein
MVAEAKASMHSPSSSYNGYAGSGYSHTNSGSHPYTDGGNHAQKARFRLETEVMKMLTDEEVKFTKSIVFGQTYSYSFRHDAQEGKFMKLDYGADSVSVTHNFGRTLIQNHYSIGRIGKMVHEFHDLVFNMFDTENSYNCFRKRMMFRKMSMQFFKCIYEHGEEIVDDIWNLNKKPI